MGLYDQMNTANGGVWNDAQANQMLGAYNSSQMNPEGLFGMSSSGWGNMGQLMGGVGALGNMALGFKSLGLMKDQIGLQQSQWDESLAELNTMRGVRSKTNAAYA